MRLKKNNQFNVIEATRTHQNKYQAPPIIPTFQLFPKDYNFRYMNP